MRRAERNGEIASVCALAQSNYANVSSDHYWPMDTVPVYYGDIKITLLNDSHYPDWIVTEFMMQRVSLINFSDRLNVHLQTFSTRVTSKESSVTSTSQPGQTSACQIHHKRSHASFVLSESAWDQKLDRLSCTAVPALDDQEHSSRSTEFSSRFRSLTTWTSSASFTS